MTETPSTQLATEGLTTLAEALEVIEDHALGVDVEIKNLPWEDDYDPRLHLVDATLDVLDEASPTGPVVLSSFNQEAIDRVREQAGDAYATALITPGAGDARELRARVLAAGHDGVVIDHEAVDAEILHTLSTGGLTLWAYTVDDPTTAAVLVADGVSGIVTDVPDEISERLDLLP
ncbi:MAG TPA: glycerophosphodiester phosphodiesterase [Acidimicrobiales bacterium]